MRVAGHADGDLARRLDAATRHGHVQQHHVRQLVAHHAHRLLRILGLADHIDVRHGTQGRDDAFTKQRMIVGDDDANRFAHTSGWTRQWPARLHGGADADRGIDLERSAQQLRPLAHAARPRPPDRSADVCRSPARGPTRAAAVGRPRRPARPARRRPCRGAWRSKAPPEACAATRS